MKMKGELAWIFREPGKMGWCLRQVFGQQKYLLLNVKWEWSNKIKDDSVTQLKQLVDYLYKILRRESQGKKKGRGERKNKSLIWKFEMFLRH